MWEKFRGWGRGCKCHEALRLLGKTIKCSLSGRRATEYAARLKKLFEDLAELRQWFGSVEAVNEFGPELVSNGEYCLAVTLGHARLKFHWVFQPPYSIWACDSPDAAQEFISTTEAQIANKDPKVHRVSCRFVLEQDGCYGKQFKAHARREGMEPELRTEMTCYM